MRHGASRIHRPQIVFADTERFGWTLIVLIVLAPWLLSPMSPWLGRLAMPRFAQALFSRSPSSAELQVEALRAEIARLRGRRDSLRARVAQVELELRIDRYVHALAEESVLNLTLQRDVLARDRRDRHRALGANAPPSVVESLHIASGR